MIFMLNSFYNSFSKKQKQDVSTSQNPADVIKRSEDISSRWVTRGLEPQENDKEKEPVKSSPKPKTDK